VIFVYGVITRQYDLDSLVAAFRETPFHLLVTGVPPGVRIPTKAERISLYPLVDVTTVLPRCTAAITHSAHGSCLATLSAGLPVVALSGPYQEYERTHNGRLLEKMKVGYRLPGVVGSKRIREAIELITRDPSYREQAKKWQKYLKHWPGPAAVVGILKGLATGEKLPPPFFSPEYSGPRAYDEKEQKVIL
jgi:UDP:flavonoid glycosyltransferase YjiC (YdhE family)